MNDLRRRSILKAGGTLLVGGLAGCSTSDSSPEGVILAGVELANDTEESYIFHLLVENDNEIISWSSHEVEPNSSEQQAGVEIIYPEMPDTPEPITVHCRVGEHWVSTDFLDEDFEEECVLATFLYGFRAEEVLSTHPTTVNSLENPPESLECP